MGDVFAQLDATAQAELVRREEARPIELVDAAIARIERLDGSLGAVVARCFERAREEARSPALPRGPFCGVPFLLKDLGAHLAGDPAHSGMLALKRCGWREAGETHFAGKLRRAGLLSLGRTNTPELGLLPTTEPASHGATRNPWSLAHSPGGSSGGSAAAVAAGLVPAAHGSDGGGSIRIPASHCGLVGMKPTRGRCSFGPALGERWAGFSAEGFLARSVRDAAALLDVVAGAMPGDPYAAAPPERPYRAELGADPGRLRVGFMPVAPRAGELHPDCRDAALAAARLLASLGHALEPAHPEALDEPDALAGFVAVVSSATALALEQAGEKVGRPLAQGDVEPLTWAVAELGRRLAAPQYVAALQRNHAWSRRLAAFWTERGFDLLLTPTCAAPPPLLGHFAGEPGNPLQGYARAVPYSTFTSAFNVSGQPAVSLPLHWNAAGLPIGVQLVAAWGREDLLFRVASQLEQAQPWSGRLPSVNAYST
jgi:amidase